MINTKNIAPRELSIAIDDNPTAAVGTLTSNNSNVTNNKKVTIGSREYVFKTTLTGAANEVEIGADADATLNNLKALINLGRAAVAAYTTLTSNGTNPSNGQQVVIGAKTYTFKTALTGVKASGTLTASDNFAEGDQIVIGSVTYIARTVLTPRFGWVANEFLIGASMDASLGNLKAAINGEAGEQTKYTPGTVAHPDVTCGSVTSHAVVITAKIPGLAGNSLDSTSTSANVAFGAETLENGVDSVANEIFIGADAATTLANLKAAVNGAAGAGTTYSYATVASTEVVAGTLTSTTLLFTAIVAGAAGNLLASTDNSATLSFTSTVFAGGVTETTVDPNVTCGDVTAHAVIVTVKVAGYAGNSIASTTDESTLSWGAATLTTGGSTIGTCVIGGGGGVLRNIISKAPQLAGTPTYTLAIENSAGVTLYSVASLAENATTNTAKEIQVTAEDVIKITTTTKVEETIPFTVYLR